MRAEQDFVKNCGVGFWLVHLLSGACKGGISGLRPQSRSHTNCFARGSFGRAPNADLRAADTHNHGKLLFCRAVKNEPNCLPLEGFTHDYHACHGRRRGPARGFRGRRSLNRGYIRARGDLGPWVTEGTAQIHRCADENRVYLHQGTCGRVDG